MVKFSPKKNTELIMIKDAQPSLLFVDWATHTAQVGSHYISASQLQTSSVVNDAIASRIIIPLIRADHNLFLGG